MRVVRPRQLEGSKSQPGSLGPTSVACRAVRAGLVESFANGLSKDDVPRAADGDTTGLPSTEKAIEPRDERMTGSSDVSSLCCKVGLRVTLFPPLGTSNRRTSSCLWMVKSQYSDDGRPDSPSSSGTSSVDSASRRKWRWGISCCWRRRLLERHPVPHGGFSCRQCGRSAILLPCCCLLWWGSGQALGRDPSIMHSHPRSTLSFLLVWSFGEAAASPMMRTRQRDASRALEGLADVEWHSSADDVTCGVSWPIEQGGCWFWIVADHFSRETFPVSSWRYRQLGRRHAAALRALCIVDDTRFARAVRVVRTCCAGLSVCQGKAGRTSTQAVVTRRKRHASQRQSGASVRMTRRCRCGTVQDCTTETDSPFRPWAMKPNSPMSVLLAASGPNLFPKCRPA